jgi:hypothetical protein
VPSWSEIGVMTNVADVSDVVVPLPKDHPSGFYRVFAQ